MLVADALDFGPVGAGRHNHAARALNGFPDEGRHAVSAQFQDLRLQLAGAGQAEILGRHVAALVEPIGLVDVFDPRNGQAALRVHPRHAAQAAAAHGRAVIAVLAADDHRFFRLALQRPVMAHHADVGVICLGPGPGEEHMVQIPRRQFGDPRGQGDGGDMTGLEEGVVERQFHHLPRRDIGQFLTAIADIDAPQPGHSVDDLVPLGIRQRDAIGAGDDPRAFLRQPLVLGKRVHVMRGIQRLQFGGGHVVGDLTHGKLRSGSRVADGDCPHDTAGGGRRQ